MYSPYTDYKHIPILDKQPYEEINHIYYKGDITK